MPRPLTRSLYRPPCPKNHKGHSTSAGVRKSRSGPHETARFWCVPDPDQGMKKHRFVEPMTHRRPGSTHPLAGTACSECEHVYARHEGPACPRNFAYTVREAGMAIAEVAAGLSLRGASMAVRLHALRTVYDPMLRVHRTSQFANLASDYVSVFGDLVVGPLAKIRWPADTLMLDAVPFFVREKDESGQKRTIIAFTVLAAFGYDRAGEGTMWAMRAAGTGTKEEWADFLASLPEEPRWIIADRDGAIAHAVGKRFAGVPFYQCEWHLTEGLKEILKPHGLADESLDFYWAAVRSVGSPEAFETFRRHVQHLPFVPEDLATWIRDKEPLLRENWALLAAAGVPRLHTAGPLEKKLDVVRKRLAPRKRLLRNLRRLDLVLGLMTLGFQGYADARRFTKMINDHLVANGLRPAVAWQHIDDPAGTSSLRAMADAVRASAPARRLKPKDDRLLKPLALAAKMNPWKVDPSPLAISTPATLRFDFSLRVAGIERHFPPLLQFAYESHEDALRTAVEVAFALTDAERSNVAISTFVCDGTGKAELPGTRIDHHRGSLTLESLGVLADAQAA